jgi:hypothetical protein
MNPHTLKSRKRSEIGQKNIYGGHMGKYGGHMGKYRGHMGKYGGHMGNCGGCMGKYRGHMGKYGGHMGNYGRHMGISPVLHFRNIWENMADIWEKNGEPFYYLRRMGIW